MINTSIQIPEVVYAEWRQRYPLWGQMSKSIVIAMSLVLQSDLASRVSLILDDIHEGVVDYNNIREELKNDI